MAEFFIPKTEEKTEEGIALGIPMYEQAETGPRFARARRRAEETTVVRMLPTADIRPNPSQPRRVFAPESIAALADSIRRYGMIQPLTVRRAPDGGELYELIAGERRLRAAISVGMAAVPCVVLVADERRSAAMAIIENLQRENLNIFEQASAISSLCSLYGLTQDEIASWLSVSQSFVANKLRLLRYLPDEREIILSASLTERHARALLRLSGDDRLTALRHVIDHHLTVADTEAYVETLLRPAEKPSPTRKSAQKPTIPHSRAVILRDVRLFYNSVHRAVEIMRQAGIEAIAQRRETPEGTEIRIRIPRTAATAPATENVSRETM